MAEDDHIPSESLCLALTKCGGLPHATRIKYTQTRLQRPKNRRNLRYTWLFSHDSAVLNMYTHIHTLSLCDSSSTNTTFVPLHTSLPARSPLSPSLIWLSFSLFSFLSPSSPAAIRHYFTWRLSLDLRESGEHPFAVDPCWDHYRYPCFQLSSLRLHSRRHGCSCFAKHIGDRGVVHSASDVSEWFISRCRGRKPRWRRRFITVQYVPCGSKMSRKHITLQSATWKT